MGGEVDYAGLVLVLWLFASHSCSSKSAECSNVQQAGCLVHVLLHVHITQCPSTTLPMDTGE